MMTEAYEKMKRPCPNVAILSQKLIDQGLKQKILRMDSDGAIWWGDTNPTRIHAYVGMRETKLMNVDVKKVEAMLNGARA